MTRAAFYYPWYPGHWNETPHVYPEMGTYSSLDRDLIKTHIALMQWGKIQVGISSWWGKGDSTDLNFRPLLIEAAKLGFKWCIHYEPDVDGKDEEFISNLSYIKTNYSSHSAYFKINKLPVIFVYKTWDGRVSKLAKTLAGMGWYVATQTPGADSQYIYNPGEPKGYTFVNGQSFSVSPGFWHSASSIPVVARDLERFKSVVAWGKAVETIGWPWFLITSWNEWPECTGIEPDEVNGFDFLDSLR